MKHYRIFNRSNGNISDQMRPTNIKLNENRDKVIEHNYFLLNERVRDMVVSKDKKFIIIFLESTSSIMILRKNS